MQSNQKALNRRTFVIGDIHGCLQAFEQLLLRFDAEWGMDLNRDRLILLGDYVDRGPDSAGVIKAIDELQSQYGSDQVTALMGNHEHMALDYFAGQNQERWMRNGASETLRSFDANPGAKALFFELAQRLKLYVEDEHYLYVHGGVRPGIALTEQSLRDLVWIREDFYGVKDAFSKPVIFGHTPVSSLTGGSKPECINGNIAVDTGCVYGGFLTGLVIEADGSWHYLQTKQSILTCSE